MKFNVALLTIISAASALPIIKKRASSNPYLVCGASDFACKQEQNTLCYEQVNECWKTETDSSKCSELSSLCNEVWSSDNSQNVVKAAQNVVKAASTVVSAAKTIPTYATSVKASKTVPTTTTTVAVKTVPTSTTTTVAVAVKTVPTSTTTTVETSSATGETTFKPNKENVKLLGRANYYEDGYLWFGLTGSGIEYKFTGKSTSITVNSDGNSSNPCRVKIYADGKAYSDIFVESKEIEIPIEFDESAEHIVRFVKVSESANGTARIYGIKADGKIEPTSEGEKKIEFIGDSITCAYGVDGADTDSFSTKNEDGTKSYAYKVAQKFNADYSMVAFSGFGIISGYTTNGERLTTSTVPQYYDKLGFSYWNQFGSDGTQIKNVKWDYNDFVPDLIVVNLGTNDNSYLQGVSSSEKRQSEIEAFAEEYQDFIAQIRSANPDSEILCTLGIMGQELYSQVEEAVNNYVKETGDKKVHAFKFNVQNISKNGKAVDWHPAHQSHVEAAYELIEEIESLYGWTADSNVNIEVDATNQNFIVNSAASASSSSSVSSASSVTAATNLRATKTPPPTNTTTKNPPTTTNTTTKNPPSTTTTKVPPTTYITSKVPPTTTTATSTTKNPPPTNTTTKTPPGTYTTTSTSSAKNPPPTTSTKSAPGTYTTTTTSSAKNPPPTTSTKSAPITSTTVVTSVKTVPVTTTTTTSVVAAKTIPTSSTTTTTVAVKTIPTSSTTSIKATKTVPTSTTTTTTVAVKTIPTSSTTSIKATKTVPTSTTTSVKATKTVPTSTTTSVKATKTVPTSTTTSVKATKTIPSSTTTVKSTKTVPSYTTTTVTKNSTQTSYSSSSSSDYFSCAAADYACKVKMANLCYEELNNCWSQPYSESVAAQCQKINDNCSKIYQ